MTDAAVSITPEAVSEERPSEDRLGMTDSQWAQWQAYTHGFGDQDENGIDLSCLRANLRLTPTERLKKHQQALQFVREVRHAGRTARLPRTTQNP